jgi:predicted enzyme related to lactoylglutathione lyase
MTAHVSHFAINADGVRATRRFYESVFGWTFSAWGPPDFFQITDGNRVVGALQRRRELLPDGQRTTGFECTVAVPDVDVAAKSALAAGGQLLMEKTTITGVGDLVFFADPSGNVVGAMRYDPEAE